MKKKINIAQALLNARDDLGLSQSQLGEELGVAAPTIGSWERGNIPNGPNRERIANFLGKNVNDFSIVPFEESEEDLHEDEGNGENTVTTLKHLELLSTVIRESDEDYTHKDCYDFLCRFCRNGKSSG